MIKKTLSYILAAAIIFVALPDKIALAAGEPGITLGSASLSAGKYYYSNSVVSGNNIRTILISFSDSVTVGDKIFLPAAPSGFTVSASSLSNDYVKRINLDAGVTADAVRNYLRGIGFTIASPTQSVKISITTENIEYDTYYNIDKQHYYQFIPDMSSSWIAAYNSARSMTYMGRTGYLATIVSRDEDTFVNSLSGGQTGWFGGTILSDTGSTGSPLYYDGFNTGSVVSTGWYWACGPEKGITFYNANSLYPNANSSNANAVDTLNTSYYYNWARGAVSYEPNNQTAAQPASSGDYETCLTTLVITNNIGKAGTAFSWNDKHYDTAGSGEWNAKGYFVEYGNEMVGDSGSVSTAFASDSGTLEAVYTATINTFINGTAADASGTVELRQSGSTVAAALSVGTGVYTAAVPDGTYDVYINNEDTGTVITITGAANSATVDYYTVSFSAGDAGKSSGSTISATAEGLPITSGAVVLSGKEVIITASGTGADDYTYVWTGNGTGGETAAVLNIPSLSNVVNANCIVTGTIYPPSVATDSDLEITPSVSGIILSGGVMSGIAAVTERGFVYGAMPDPVLGYAGSKKIVAGSGTGSFTATLTGLEPDTVYYVRAYAVNSEGTSYGAVISFKTEKGDIPNTGDNSFNLILWLLCVLSLAGIAVWKKKRNI